MPAVRSSLLFKIVTCVLASIAVGNTLLFFLLALFQGGFVSMHSIVSALMVGYAPFSLLIGLAAGFWWQRTEQKNAVDSGLWAAYLQGIIRYWLAFAISTYGFAKILKTQFASPEYIHDLLVGELSGFELTWYYFGYSYALAVIIALFQIGGSILLLYRRTTLAGAVILFPVIANILFINIFFEISPGALLNVIVYLAGLSYLFWLNFVRLKAAFWDVADNLPNVSLGSINPIVRLLPIAAAFAFLYFLVATNHSDQELTGTWVVERFERNNKIIPLDAGYRDTTVISRIYLSNQSCVLSPNPQVYRPQQSLKGNYTFDKTTNRFLFQFRNQLGKSDSLVADISRRTDDYMILKGTMGKDTIRLELNKLARTR